MKQVISNEAFVRMMRKRRKRISVLIALFYSFRIVYKEQKEDDEKESESKSSKVNDLFTKF